jgi:putative acetyltransferase
VRPATSGAALRCVFRAETGADIAVIDVVTRAAFRDHPFSTQTEPLIVRALREAGAPALSLVAVGDDGELLGHAALSPVTADRWAGSGWAPVSVSPPRQRAGGGSALIRSALRRLQEQGATGCVVLGDPAYCSRFGFAPHAGLVLRAAGGPTELPRGCRRRTQRAPAP